MTQETAFKMDLQKYGVQEAQRRQAVRRRWNAIRKDEKSPCRNCESALMCGLCSYGGA